MAQYGELLDEFYDPVKDSIYALFSSYFENPLMTKLKDVTGHSMYICKIHALLGIEFRYVIIFVYKDEVPFGTQIRLSNLPWLSLQTRSLQEEHNIPYHTYIPRRLQGLEQKISLIHKDFQQYKYKVENLPLIITLLPKTKNDMEYNNNGTLVTAIETYHTIISFKN